MKSLKLMLLGAGLLMLSGCGPQVQRESESTATEKSDSEAVIETIMSRRSIRKYKPEAVNRDTMKVILDCGINAPNPKAAEDPDFKNMFRNAPTVVFIGNDTSYDCSQIDCGLLGENMVLAAWSMGIGSCCLASPTRFMADTPEAAEYLKRLELPEGYKLLYCIAFGYPDEAPAAKPRDAAKVKYID